MPGCVWSGEITVSSRSKSNECCNLTASSPRAIRRSFAGVLVAAAVHVADARLRLVGRNHGVICYRYPGIARVGEGVPGKLLEITGLHQVLQGLGGLLFIESVLVNK